SAPPLGGMVTARAQWRGPAAAPSVKVALAGRSIRLDGAAVGEVTADVAWEKDSLVIEGVRVAHPDGGMLTGSGSVGLGTHHGVQLSVHLHDAPLPLLLEAGGIRKPWVRMLINGDLEGAGELAPFGLSLAADLAAKDFQVLDGPYDVPHAAQMLSIPAGTVRGTARLGPRGVDIAGIEVAAGSSTLNVEGGLSYDVARGMDLRVVTHDFELGDVGTIAGVPFSGRGGFAATVEGPYENATVASTLEAKGLRIFGYPVGDSSATIIFNMPTLQIDRLTVRHGDGTVSGAGRLYFDRPNVEAEAALDAEALSLRDLIGTLGLPGALARHFEASVSGRLILAGPIIQPTGVAYFKAPDLQVDGVSLGAMGLEGSFGDVHATVAGTLTLNPRDGELTCHAELRHDDTLVLQARTHALPLPLITPFMGDVALTGSLSGEATLEGPPERLSGHVTADVNDLTAYGVRLEHTVLEGDADGGALRVDGHLLGGDAVAQATITLGRRMPHEARATFKSIATDRLWPLGADMGAQIAGTVTSSGDLTRPETLVADARFASATVQWRQLVLRAVAPVAVHFERDRYILAPMQLAGDTLLVRLAGTLPVDEPMDLQLAVDGDLAVGTTLTPQLAGGQGPFDIKLLIGGHFGHPTISGEADVHHGSLRLSQSEMMIDKLDLHAVLSGHSVAIQSGSAHVGGGRVRFSGEAQFDRDAEVSLRADLQSVQLHPLPDLDATLTGDLELTGAAADRALKGNLEIESLRYTARLELERLIPRRNAPPLRVPTVSPGQSVQLGVKLQARNNVIISSNVLEAELQADLTLTGTSERPGLLGNVTPLWARARYRDNVFKVMRASIDFVDEYRIFTEFQLQARTEACKMQADVSIQGNSDRYTVLPYGQDARGAVDPQDVLACLQFGLRLRDFDGNQRAPASFGDALPGSLDALWTVSGLDDKVRKLLPISVDELRLTSGWSSLSQRTTARLQVGKELGHQVALRYSRSLDEYNDQAFSLEYRLSEKATMQGSWLSARDVPVGDFGVDLRLHWELQ
ncbi:MAG TPA: translocation/assembly module TamB domain-containing protein, partial [Myxococcota bacterium]|nr:translocation/assembly module TamB domain-containing protein [Myxococcota bacterium]